MEKLDLKKYTYMYHKDIEFDTNIQNTDVNEYGLSLVGSSLPK